jgi:hypothetical protein
MHPIEICLSFLEGLALVVSPCILPVLPLVLATSVEGGCKRPFGVIFGFVVAFTLFALLSRKLVMAFHINLDSIKYASLILLAMFGLILLSEKLSGWFSCLTQRFANAGNNLTVNTKEGFGGGILIGMLIGLVWTPCAGPILAAILVQVIRQESDLQALFLIAAFAFGAGVPMLIIALAGRNIISRLGFFAKHSEEVRKTFGVIILVSVVIIASGFDFARSKNNSSSVAPNTKSIINELKTPYAAPEFAGIGSWLNSEPLNLANLKGKVVLVDFWTYSCINCVRTFPYITQWDKKYRDKGLVIIGIHSPEFEFEKNESNVKAALIKHGINYPVALDNKLDTWVNFKNQFWPAHYLIDREGRVVYTHFGEGDYDITENNIRTLLGLNKVVSAIAERQVVTRGQTTETYLGSARAANFNSQESLTGGAHFFTMPDSLPLNKWALSGKWNIEKERITAEESPAKLSLHFTSGKVFVVLGTKDGSPVEAKVILNGNAPGANAGKDAPDGKLTVHSHALYEIINQNSVKEGVVEITTQAAGLEVYAFTFGN